MNILIMVGQLILGLSILVILHELGHFLAARAFKIRVENFIYFSMLAISNFLVLKKEKPSMALVGSHWEVM
jgi:membrane-associated protease RseP (regulator of RpoE activity)